MKKQEKVERRFALLGDDATEADKDIIFMEVNPMNKKRRITGLGGAAKTCVIKGSINTTGGKTMFTQQEFDEQMAHMKKQMEEDMEQKMKDMMHQQMEEKMKEMMDKLLSHGVQGPSQTPPS